MGVWSHDIDRIGVCTLTQPSGPTRRPENWVGHPGRVPACVIVSERCGEGKARLFLTQSAEDLVSHEAFVSGEWKPVLPETAHWWNV